MTVVLIGAQTSQREYVNYEIRHSHAIGNGMLGIYIHNMKDGNGLTDTKGKNPFDNWKDSKSGRVFSSIYPTYDWVIDRGRENLGAWIEKAAKAAGR